MIAPHAVEHRARGSSRLHCRSIMQAPVRRVLWCWVMEQSPNLRCEIALETWLRHSGQNERAECRFRDARLVWAQEDEFSCGCHGDILLQCVDPFSIQPLRDSQGDATYPRHDYSRGYQDRFRRANDTDRGEA